uniref:Replication protein A 70 kDa DNA-binding subunit B/D first OB fold domain-containing protein n=1 Tax=Glycine max TaxID=3847 RepID=K7LII0_SOYBN
MTSDKNNNISFGLMVPLIVGFFDDYYKIMNIDGSKETLKLAVRISDLWFVGMPDKSEQAKMVFVDSDGDEIHVIYKQDQLKSWKMDLKENCTYVMHNFNVLKNNGQYRVCDHQFKLVFTGVIVVRQSILDDLPFRKYRFAGFANVVAGQSEPGLLVDIISVMDEVVFHHVSGVVFKLKDLGSYPPSVSNSFKASKLIINQLVMEIQEFNERYRLEVMINHKDESTKFLLWDRECTELICQSADAVDRHKIADGDVDLNTSPQALDKLLGYVLAFKIKV